MRVWSVPPWLSTLPPVATLLLAVWLRQVMVGLLIGIWLGATIAYGGNPLTGALRTVDRYLVGAVGSDSHPLIIVFTLLLGGMIAVVQRSGGASGLARLATRYTTQPSHVLLAAAGLCCATSFDDYCAILITGSALRPVAIAQHVPPLRLCWVLHGAGVVAPSLNPLSSWMGVQLGYLLQQVALLDGLDQETSALSLLLSTVPYRFYSVLYLVFILLMLTLPWASDFGAMLRALGTDVDTQARAQPLPQPLHAAQADGGLEPYPPIHAALSINSDRRVATDAESFTRPHADSAAPAAPSTSPPHPHPPPHPNPLLRCFWAMSTTRSISPDQSGTRFISPNEDLPPPRPATPGAPAAPSAPSVSSSAPSAPRVIAYHGYEVSCASAHDGSASAHEAALEAFDLWGDDDAPIGGGTQPQAAAQAGAQTAMEAAAAATEEAAEAEAEAEVSSPLGDAPPQLLYALLPFASLLLGTPLGMWLDGRAKAPPGAGLLTCFAKADSTAALTWSTFFGCVLSIALPLCRSERCSGRPRTSLSTLMSAWVDGVREVTDCLVILLLAWALGALVHDLHTAQFLAAALGAWLPPGLLPAAATLLAMLVSFGVGSAWGAMGILLPLVGPLVWQLSPLEGRLELLTCASP